MPKRLLGKTPGITIPPMPVIWVVLALFLPIEGLAVYFYHVSSEAWKSTIVFAASVVGGAFALYSHLKHIEEVRVVYAAKLIERWGSPLATVDSWKDLLRDITAGKIINVEQYARKREPDGKMVLPDDLTTRSKIIGLLSYAEEVALAIRTKNADEELIKRQLEGVLTTSFVKLEPWIKREREVAGGDNSIYGEIAELVAGWTSREK